MRDHDRIANLGESNGGPVDLSVDSRSPHLGSQDSQAAGNEWVTHVKISNVIMTGGDSRVERDRQPEVLNLVVQTDKCLTPSATEVTNLENRY